MSFSAHRYIVHQVIDSFTEKHTPNRIKRIRYKFNSYSKPRLKRFNRGDLDSLKFSVQDGKVFLGDYCLDSPNRQRIDRIG